MKSSLHMCVSGELTGFDFGPGFGSGSGDGDGVGDGDGSGVGSTTKMHK